MSKLDTARCALSTLLVAGACATPVAREAPAPARAVDTVAVGYGRVPHDHLTGAVSSLTEEDIASAQATRVVELFQGRLPGVQVLRGPTGNLTLRIRGAQGLGYSDEEPLVVIDGMPTENTGWSSVLDALMPQDITRIDVLKDAGSTAAYGVRGANGVILITTKRGHP
jgi:TonB-dependent outer membrane receptor, SusC/RagA subfamily, signature region